MAKNETDNPLKNELVETSDGKTKRSRATAAQKEMRVQKVAQWLINGKPRQEIIKEGKKQWGLGQRSVEFYITDANEMIEFTGSKEVEAALAKQLTRLADIYHAAFSKGDMKSALDAIKTEARLLGLNAPDKSEVTEISKIADMSGEERAERLTKILNSAKNREPNTVN